MLGASQRIDALDGQQVRGDSGDPGAHAVEHSAELLYVGFAGGVVDGGGAAGHDGGHDDIGRTGHGGFVEQHVGPLQLLALDHEELVGDVEIELGAEFLESEEMGVEATSSDLVSAGFGNVPDAESGEHGSDEHHGTAQTGATVPVVVGLEVFEVDVAGLEGVGVVGELFDDDAHAAEEFDELEDVEDTGDVPHDDAFGC